MRTFWLATFDLRWNAGVLEQKFRTVNPGPEYGKSEWREVPDVLPRRDELPPAISRYRGASWPATRGAAAAADMAIARAAPVAATFGATATRGAASDPDFREVGEPARSAFYEFTITSATAARLRSVSPVQIEGRPGLWREVLYDRKPEPLRDTDRLTYETVAEILRSHSSPTMGAPGSVHGGQRGFIVYETDGLPFIVSRLAELATLDDGRTAKDMLHDQGSEIDRLKKLADYQAEEITRLEDTARLGLSDDPAVGATLAAVMKERDELREKLPNFEAHVANLTREFHEELALVRRERDELQKRLTNTHAFDDRNQAAAARERAELREKLHNVEIESAARFDLVQVGRNIEAALTKERDELRTAHDNARAALAASEREVAKLLAAIDSANVGNADIAHDRDVWKARAVMTARERDEARGKRNEWQRRALAAEQRGAEARVVLARIRKAIDE